MCSLPRTERTVWGAIFYLRQWTDPLLLVVVFNYLLVIQCYTEVNNGLADKTSTEPGLRYYKWVCLFTLCMVPKLASSVQLACNLLQNQFIRFKNIMFTSLCWQRHIKTIYYQEHMSPSSPPCLLLLCTIPTAPKGCKMRQLQDRKYWTINDITQLNSTQPEITDAGVWHLYVRIINNITIL